MGFSFLLAVSALAVSTGAFKFYNRPSHLSNRPIVGGVDAEISNFPYQVSLAHYYNNSGEISTMHFCGGSVISVEWVLTAAHCVRGSHPDDLLVRVGTSTRDEGGSLHEVTKIISHAEYDRDIGTDYDIALLKVAKPFQIGLNVKPIRLTRSPVQTGRIAVVSGWGTTTEGGESPLNLQKVQIPIMPQWECKLAYRKKISDNMFCAGRAGRSACHGDSGGAVVVDGYQIGIVSWGESCELPGKPGVYVNVYNFRSWIHKNCGV